MTVPAGHSHSPILQTAGQTSTNLLTQFWGQGEAHFILTCPFTGHAI